MSGYGPDCPNCKQSAEWTEGEISEAVFSPKTYCCNHCYQFYVLDIDEVQEYQKQAQALMAQWDKPKTETEEDWKKAREQWDKHDE